MARSIGALTCLLRGRPGRIFVNPTMTIGRRTARSLVATAAAAFAAVSAAVSFTHLTALIFELARTAQPGAVAPALGVFGEALLRATLRTSPGANPIAEALETSRPRLADATIPTIKDRFLKLLVQFLRRRCQSVARREVPLQCIINVVAARRAARDGAAPAWGSERNRALRSQSIFGNQLEWSSRLPVG